MKYFFFHRFLAGGAGIVFFITLFVRADIPVFSQSFIKPAISIDLKASGKKASPMFYGLFLRGHSADSIRAEIDIPPRLFRKWMRAREWDENFRNDLQKMYQYRKQVLAIFDSLVTSEKAMSSWQ